MRAFSERWVRGWRWLLLSGLVACGGLAEDGPRPFASSGAAPELDVTGAVTAQHATAPANDGLEPSPAVEPQSAAAGSSRVGQPCGPLGEETQTVVVGEVQLQQDARCGVGNACLLRSPVAFDCRESVRSGAVECTRENVDFIPVPPRGAPDPAWQQDLCTCRCDGNALDADYCSCPAGMRCEPLIPSSGANAAARPYVGSYCVF